MSAVDNAVQYWHMALASPFGLGLVVTDPLRAKNQLYAARKKALPSCPALATITLRTSPSNPACQLYLVKELRQQDGATGGDATSVKP